MSGVINYAFSPNTIVYVIIPCDLAKKVNTSKSVDIRVSEGRVIQFEASIILTGETMKYHIEITGRPGTVPVLTTDIFATLAEATAEYELRLM